MSNGWQMCRFDEVIDVYQPETVAVKNLDVDGTYPVYGANGIIGYHSQFNHSESELLLGCRGSVGSVHISSSRSWINGNAMVVRPKDTRLTRDFIRYGLLGGFSIADAISGTAQPQITRTSLAPVLVPVPPLDEQKRIVAKLDQALGYVDEVVDSAQKSKEEISALWQQTLAKFFDLSNNEPLNPREGSETPAVPLSDLCSKITDGSHNPPKGGPESEFLMLSSRDIQNDQIAPVGPRFLNEKQFNDEHRRTNLVHGDVLLTIVGTIGRAAIYLGEPARATLQRSVAVMTPKEALLNPRYLMYFFHSSSNFFESEAQGTAQKGFYLGQLREMLIPWISIDEQSAIVDKLDNLKSEINTLDATKAATLTEAANLRATVLSAAFAGDL